MALTEEQKNKLKSGAKKTVKKALVFAIKFPLKVVNFVGKNIFAPCFSFVFFLPARIFAIMAETVFSEVSGAKYEGNVVEMEKDLSKALGTVFEKLDKDFVDKIGKERK